MQQNNFNYVKHYSKILIEKSFKNPSVIPEDWWQFTREQVTEPVRKNAIKIGIEKWITWEKETKKIYE